MSKNIQDFGAKIGGARKDIYGGGMSYSDYENLSEEGKKEFTTKGNIWKKMDYNKLVSEGYNPIQVGWVKIIYDAIDKVPYSSFCNEGYFKLVSGLRDLAIEGMKMPYNDWKYYVQWTKKDGPNFYNDYIALREKVDAEVFNRTGGSKGEGYCGVMKADYNRKMTKAVCQTEADVKAYLVKKDILLTKEQQVKLATDIIKIDGVDNKLVREDYSFSNRLKLQIKESPYSTIFRYSDLYKDLQNGQYLIYNKVFEDVFDKLGIIDSLGLETTKEEVAEALKLSVSAKTEDEAIKNYNIVCKTMGKLFDEIYTKSSEKAKEQKTAVKSVKKKAPFNSGITIDYDKRRNCEYQIDKTITGQDYLDTFKFYGGEFGNWLSDKDRQTVLNCGFDSFLDLAYALKIEPASIGLGDKLSIAFGARGKGGASAGMAHYEPLYNVINLTKMKGAGCLAHEWGHALDFYLSGNGMKKEMEEIKKSLRGKPKGESTRPTIEKYTENAVNSEMGACRAHPEQKQIIKDLIVNRLADKPSYSKVEHGIIQGEYAAIGPADLLEDKEYIKNKIIELTGDEELFNRLDGWIDSIYTQGEYVYSRTEDTKYLKDSLEFDNKYNKMGLGYWADDKEMFARAFDQFVCDELGYTNQFLTTRENLDKQPTPKGEEREQFAVKMKELLTTAYEKGLLKEKEYTTDEPLKEFFSPFVEEQIDHLPDELENYQYDQLGLEI